MATGTTKLTNMINPEVMADMISAKIKEKVVVTPFAKIDDTLTGTAGDTIKVPSYEYIGDAEDVAEGVEVGTTVLSATSTSVTIKKAMKAVELTDEAVLSGYGNPIGEANSQLAKSIASKVDADGIVALGKAQLKYTNDATKLISYEGIVDAIDLFDEEVATEKVMFVNPKQITTLRKDPKFISADKYDNDVMMKGEIGMIAGARIVPSKRVKAVSKKYSCPIIILNEADVETVDEAPALTIFLKRDVNVETERFTLARKTAVSADEFYAVAITNQSKVVVAEFASEL